MQYRRHICVHRRYKHDISGAGKRTDEKTKFALRKWLLLFCWCILIYFLEMLMYNIPLNWGRFLIESAAALLLMAAVQGLCILLAATQDWWSRRMGTTAEG